MQGQHGGVDLHRQVFPGTEGAAHPGQADPHLVSRQAQARRDLAAVDMEPLRGDVDIDAPVLSRHGHSGLGTEKRLVLHADLVVTVATASAVASGFPVPDVPGIDLPPASGRSA